MYRYYQIAGGEEAWKPVQEEHLDRVVESKKPMFITVLATNQIASKDMPREEKLSLRYTGPMYVDFDAQDDIASAIRDLQSFCRTLRSDHALPVEAFRLYATGSKGFHVEIPLAVFVTKVNQRGYENLPLIYKAIANKYAEQSMDFRVYSIGMGRMWRQPNVQRPNGRYKVPLTWEQMESLTEEMVVTLTSSPIPVPVYAEPEVNIDLAVVFDKAMQDIELKLKRLKKRKPVDPTIARRPLPSMDALMDGKGIKSGAGFNQIAMQIAIYAREAHLDEDTIISRCAGLIKDHVGDGHRYNTPEKRESELRRMLQVVGDDPCYEFAPEPIRALLTHAAPDLDGITVDKADILSDIAQAEANAQVFNEEGASGEPDLDEFADVANGVEVTKYGIYADGEFGKRRICSVSVDNVMLLRSMESGKLVGLAADVLVNGRKADNQPLDVDTLYTVNGLNKWAARYGHAFQGSEAHARSTYMRIVEKGRRMGSEVYVHEREGLGLVNIPHHADEQVRTPFLIWSDAKGVVLDPRVQGSNIQIRFQGFPDPRGVYKVDLSDAPPLAQWLQEDGNKDSMGDMLTNLFRCQRAEMLGPMIGWYVATFYKALFQKAYNQFPILHVAGPAGSGKTQMSTAIAKFFYYNQEPKLVSPSSTVFALGQFASGSDSIPMIVDEYKPHEMPPGMHDKLKLMFRDAYNARDLQRGGGNRESTSYQAISTTTLAAPMMFIAEGIEEETALMERVVLVTVAPPPAVVAFKWASRFAAFKRQAHLLALLGKYLAGKLVLSSYSVDKLREEFDPIYAAARDSLMLTEDSLNSGLTAEELREKQAARERSVYNFAVAQFGLKQLEEIITSIFGDRFAEDFLDFNANAYKRMKDLAPSTVPEYLKVFNTMVDCSYEVPDMPYAIRLGSEYGFANIGGRDVLELNARAAYSRYRVFCRHTNVKPLYSGEQSFIHALRNVPALVNIGEGSAIRSPGGTHIFDLEELLRLGLRGFKEPRR